MTGCKKSNEWIDSKYLFGLTEESSNYVPLANGVEVLNNPYCIDSKSLCKMFKIINVYLVYRILIDNCDVEILIDHHQLDY